MYYVQYVHARIRSIFDNAAAKGVDPAASFDEAKAQINPEERALMLKLLWFEKALTDCASDNSPHHLTTYLTELAVLFHFSFYDQHKVLDPENKEVTAYRLFLLKAVQGMMAKGLHGLLGVSAPSACKRYGTHRRTSPSGRFFFLYCNSGESWGRVSKTFVRPRLA